MNNFNKVLLDKAYELLDDLSDDYNDAETGIEYHADRDEYLIVRYFDGLNTQVWQVNEEGYEYIGLDY